jgi:hypothetical protein
MPQSPGVAIGVLPASLSVPSAVPAAASKALILPSPKLPISSALLNVPKSAGASAIPHGAFSAPAAMSYLISLPLVS